MKNQGWVFHWNDSHIYLTGGKYCKDVPSTSYCGFKSNGDGQISYTFWYDGECILEYGQSKDSGSIHIKKNNKEISSSNTRGSSNVTFGFHAGDILTIRENRSVINIHRLTLKRWLPKEPKPHGEYNYIQRHSIFGYFIGICN